MLENFMPKLTHSWKKTAEEEPAKPSAREAALAKRKKVKEPTEPQIRAFHRRERRLKDRRARREEAKRRQLAWKFDFWGFPHVDGVSAMEAREAEKARAKRNAEVAR